MNACKYIEITTNWKVIMELTDTSECVVSHEVIVLQRSEDAFSVSTAEKYRWMMF